MMLKPEGSSFRGSLPISQAKEHARGTQGKGLAFDRIVFR